MHIYNAKWSNVGFIEFNIKVFKKQNNLLFMIR